MTSKELHDEVAKIQEEARVRILTVGKDSYEEPPGYATPFGQVESVRVTDETQRFEMESVDDHLRELEEEMFDTINWASMTVLKIRKRRLRLAQAGRTTA